MQLSPYLFFRGQCEEALRFYEAAGLGQAQFEMRYGDAPGHGPQGDPNWIMHSTFRGDGVTFMASDAPAAEPMKGVALSIGMQDLDQAHRLFDALSAGGQVSVPLAKQFWGATFGMWTDRFGVQWQINCG